MGIFGSGGGGAGGGTVTGGSITTVSETTRVELLTDPASLLVAPVLDATTDEGVFSKRTAATVGAATIFYTGAEAITYALSGGTPQLELQLVFGSVRLLKGTKCIARCMVYTLDNVPAIRFGLFNTHQATALLSAVTDSIFMYKAGAGVTAAIVHEWNNNGETSVASPLSWPLARFIDLSIEIAMDDNVAGAGVVVFRQNGQVLLQKEFDAAAAASTIPYDEDLYLTLLASGDGTVGVAAPVLAVTTAFQENA